MDKPILQTFSPLIGLATQRFERYIPSSFDDSLNLLEKVNKVIIQMDRLGQLSNDVVEQWNQVMEWVMNEGMEESVLAQFNQWYESGKLADLVSQIIDELNAFGADITNYGADPTGQKDSYEAIMKAIASGYPVFIPDGDFGVSKGIAFPDNFVLLANSNRSRIFFLDSAPRGETLLYNENIEYGNKNIYISNVTLDGNTQRLGTGISGIGGSRESNLSIRGCENVFIDNVKSINATLHCIDVTCAGLDYPYLGDGTTAPRPSRYVTISNCETSGFGDDGITTHHSEYVHILNNYSHDPRLRDNCNGIEVDDGSRHIMLTGNRSARCYGGVEVKAHADSSAPYDVVINGHMSVEDVRSYNFRHIGHHSATDPDTKSARNIVASNLVSVNPNNTRSFQDDSSPRVLAISAYYGVIINGLTAYTNNSSYLTDTCIAVQFKARNISLNGIALTGFSQAENGIYVIGGSRNGDSVNISNVTLLNSGKYGVSIGSGIENVNITNVSAIMENGSGIAAVATINSNPQIMGVNATGYGAVCRVAGTDYNEGLTLLNGAFRSSSTSSGFIHKEGAVISSTTGSSARESKTMVHSSSDSHATGERSEVTSSSQSTASGTGSGVHNSGSSQATGNRATVLNSFGVIADGSYKVNGGYGDLDANSNPRTSNKKWELDSLNGHIKATGQITGASVWSDYGEYFESYDGMSIEAGFLVTLEGDKIRKANEGDKIIGSISKTAGLLLGEATFGWSNMYLTDEFGGYIMEEQVREDEEGHKEVVMQPKINPAYDPDQEYVSRANRLEWCIVGLVGQLFMRIDDTVQVGQGIAAKDGIATNGSDGVVMKITTPYDATKGYGVAKVLWTP